MTPSQQQQRPSAQQGARRLLEFLADAAHNVILESDDHHGRFGVLYDPPSMLESLVQVATTEENVGLPSLPPPVAVHSLQYSTTPYLDLLANKAASSSSAAASIKEWHQIPVQIQSSCMETIRIRWVDPDCGIRASHTWNLPPRSFSTTDRRDLPTWMQYCSPGHFFLLSIVRNNDGNDTIPGTPQDTEEDLFSTYDQTNSGATAGPSTAPFNETILGAYRPLRPLPSGKYHTLVVRELQPHETAEGYRQFFVELALSDPYDALCVAAASLDPHSGGSSSTMGAISTTVKLLATIVANVVQHPDEAKYQRLRLSNPKIQSHLMSSWGAVQILTLCGFERRTLPIGEKGDEQEAEKEEFLVIPPVQEMEFEEIASLRETQAHAQQLLQILKERTVAGFLPDLAPPTPWEPSRVVIGGGGGSNQRWAESLDRRRGFVSAEERWARAERVNRNRRNGRGRRPDPGNAPSSRGNWGR